MKDEYIDIGYQDIGMNPKDVPSHDVMTVGGSTIRDVWESFHSATSKKDDYRFKDNMNAFRTGENREYATNYVKYEKGSEGFTQVMNYLRKYYKKMNMKKNNSFLILILGITIALFQISCSIQLSDCHHFKYLSLSKVDNNRQHVDFSYGVSSANNFFDDDRILFRKSNLRKSDKVKALEEYLCFYKNEIVSNKMYSQKYGRIQNRIILSNENIEFSVEVEALYSLTTMLFEDNVAISPVIVNKKTGKICNFERKEMDEVYTIYRTWFRRMKKGGFSKITWPLKNSDYMWLGEDIINNIEILIKKEM